MAIPITLTFSEPATVTGTPQLALNASSGAVATYTGGSGTSALTFTYTAAAGDSTADLDYTSTTALALDGGTIEDAAGNAAVLTLPATGTDGLASQNITIDTTPPTVTSLSPSTGSTAGGTTVTIDGADFTSDATVDFGSGNPATNVVVNAAGTEITCTSPAGTGVADVTVTTDGGASATSSADQFTYIAMPTVAGISPTAGPAAGGTSVTITGAGFTGTTAVDFGSTAATSFVVDSDTQITATSPGESADTVDVTVTGPGGTSTTSSADEFTYMAATVDLTWSGPGSALNLVENTPGATPTITISEPSPNGSVTQSTDQATIVTLASFNGNNGANPWGGSLVEDSSGNFFGTTCGDVPNSDGTVFEIAAGSDAIKTLATFDGTNGIHPWGSLIKDSSGNLFGTTNQGGPANYGADWGTVFEVKANSGVITTLASFDGTNGANPVSGLAEDSSGNLFGTTTGGGPGNDRARCSRSRPAAVPSPRSPPSTAPTGPTPAAA